MSGELSLAEMQEKVQNTSDKVESESELEEEEGKTGETKLCSFNANKTYIAHCQQMVHYWMPI